MKKITRYLSLLFILIIVGTTSNACSAFRANSAQPTIQPDMATNETTTNQDQVTITPPSEETKPTYFTPAQQEGPYYPVEFPDDRDSDLVAYAGATSNPAGEVLILNGVVYDAMGVPVEGAVVEIWQTDSNGIYLHPGDPGTDQRDLNFQFYGLSKTGLDGVYSFRTILPGHYEPRPRHIHLKVNVGGEEVLTTQFYFGDEVSYTDDRVHLIIDLAPAEDDAGNPVWIGQRDIVLKINR